MFVVIEDAAVRRSPLSSATQAICSLALVLVLILVLMLEGPWDGSPKLNAREYEYEYEPSGFLGIW